MRMDRASYKIFKYLLEMRNQCATLVFSWLEHPLECQAQKLLACLIVSEDHSLLASAAWHLGSKVVVASV